MYAIGWWERKLLNSGGSGLHKSVIHVLHIIATILLFILACPKR